MIAGKWFLDGTLVLIDSLKDHEIVTTVSEINKIYHAVDGMYTFNNLDNGERLCFKNILDGSVFDRKYFTAS